MKRFYLLQNKIGADFVGVFRDGDKLSVAKFFTPSMARWQHRQEIEKEIEERAA